MTLTLVIGYLAFKYNIKKELTLRALINGIALAICAEVAEGGRRALRQRRAARGRPPSVRIWLEVILATCSTLCSTGERSASAEHGEKGDVGCAPTSMPCGCARRAISVSIRASRRLLLVAHQGHVSGSVIHGI